MKKFQLAWPMSPLLLTALILSIPAFYLVLTGADSMGSTYRNAGHALYGVVAVMVAIDILSRRRRAARAEIVFKIDLVILLGALASSWPAPQAWTDVEWLLRLAFCGIVFVRLSTMMARYVTPHRLLQIVALAVVALGVSGAGFFWLEPSVETYADGVWLAFTTGATVGYGDLVPSTPASRIFAVFIVLLGYAIFSIVTASIAALLVGEDEKLIRRELHADMRLLRAEIGELRAELRASLADRNRTETELK